MKVIVLEYHAFEVGFLNPMHVLFECDTLEELRMHTFERDESKKLYLLITHSNSPTRLLCGQWHQWGRLDGRIIGHQLYFQEVDEKGHYVPNGWEIESTRIPVP